MSRLLAPGWRANATIGRAVRLILMNIEGARPGEMDQKTQGQSDMFSLSIAENENSSPWEPFHVKHGVPKCESTVTVFDVSPGEVVRGGAVCGRSSYSVFSTDCRSDI